MRRSGRRLAESTTLVHIVFRNLAVVSRDYNGVIHHLGGMRETDDL